MRRQRATWLLLNGDGRLAAIDRERRVATLAFDKPWNMRGFVNSRKEQVVAAALTDLFGGQWRVETIVGGTGPAPRPAPAGGGFAAAPPPAPSAVPAGGPAPGAHPAAPPAPRTTDETWPTAPPPEDEGAPPPDLPPPVPPVPSPGARGGGEWSAALPGRRTAEADEVDPENDADAESSDLTGVALIQRELGGRIIEEIDHT